MRIVKNEFPNPVLALGRDDYIETCQFKTTFEEKDITVDDENITIPISYVLECNGINQLINDDMAVVVISVKSSAASFSKLFYFEKGYTNTQVTIPKYNVVKQIEISGLIIAKEHIKRFECPGEFNEIYFANATFDIRKGDILACEDSRTIYIDDTELEKPISSIFNITRNSNAKEAVSAEFYDQKIEIFLNEELYKLYYDFKDFNNGSLRRYLTGIIVYPVLIEAITQICGYYQSDADNETDMCDRRWFRAIELKAEKVGVNLAEYQESYVSLANSLLGDVALDALRSFKDTLDSEMNSEESMQIGGVD